MALTSFGLRRQQLGCSLPVFLLCSLAALAAAGEPSPKGSLSGTIVGPGGQPVSNARIWVNTWGDKRLAEARSDAQGHFRLGPVAPVYRHPFGIFIEADGFAPQCVWGQTYSIFPGVDCSLGKIQLDRGRVFTGEVFDVDGKPFGNARVNYTVVGQTNHRIDAAQQLTTDSQGRFRTLPLPVGRLSLWVTAPERQLAGTARLVQPGGGEMMESFHLVPDVPIWGVVKDERGRPVAGLPVQANAEYSTTSDSRGRFAIRGFGPYPRFQLRLDKQGYVPVNWIVTVRADGFHWHTVAFDEDAKDHGPFPELSVTLTPTAWIEGRAIDAETGKPVRLNRLVLCFFERKPNGETVLSGCTSVRFEQAADGRFRVPYSDPDEYHLTFSAEGYHDAEAFTPKVSKLERIEGIVVKLKKKADGTAPEVPKQTISGTVTRQGKPVKTGWVGLWELPEKNLRRFGWQMRGRTTVPDPFIIRSTPIRDGTYSLDVPYQKDDWYVVAETPGQPLTQLGPIKIGLNEKRSLDIACTEGGSIRGRVKDVPSGWEGCIWAVAFTKTAILAETRVSADGQFVFPQLPPGQYGLKVGHDAYEDAELRSDRRQLSKAEAYQEMDPWRRAKVVTVEAGREAGPVELELPP